MKVIDDFRHEIKEKLGRWPQLWLEQEFTKEELDGLCRRYAPRSRHRVWPLRAMLSLWLAAGLHRERAFNAVICQVWGALCEQIPALAGLTVSSARWAEGRARVPATTLRAIREMLADRGEKEGRGIGTWRNRCVLFLDGSTFTMPDERPLKERYGTPRNQHGQAPYPVGRMVQLGIAWSRVVIGVRTGPYGKGEKELSQPLIEQLDVGDVLLADRNFANAEMLAKLKLRGADGVMRMNQTLNVALHRHKKIGTADWLVDWPIPRKARQAHPELPTSVLARVFRAQVGQGKTRRAIWIQTTLLDPIRYPKEELAQLYLQRWGAETAYAELKVGLHLDILRSKTVDGVEREIEARLAAYNYVRLLILRAAKKAGIAPQDIGFTEAVRTIHRVGQVAMGEPRPCRVHQLHRLLLRRLAACRVKHRPGRTEPRAIRRPPKPYQRLKTSRAEWKNLEMAAAA